MDEKDFAEIVKSSKGVVLSAIEKNLAERFSHAIDDVAQETYLRAYKGLMKNQFRGDSSMSTWIYTIARNESLRMNKKLEREEEKARKSMEIHEEMAAADKEDNSIALLKDYLSRLPDKYRSVLTLVSAGHSTGDIAEKLNIRQGTVKSRTSRGKKLMHQMMTEGEDERKNYDEK